MSHLVTGEAVALDLRTADVPSRAVAAGIDGLAQLAVLLGFGGLAAAAGDGLSEAANAALGIVAIVVVLIVYPVVFETLLRGRTPGKAAMGLRVVRDDGGPIGFRQALVRGVTGGFVEKPGISVYLVAIVVSLGHPSGKRLGDLLAGTVVVNERVARVKGGGAAQMPPSLAGWASTLELSRLPDALAEQVRQFLGRESQLTARAREDLGARLVAAVAEVTAPPPPQGTPGWAFLAAVVAERRRREAERYAQRAPGPSAPGPGQAYGSAPAPGPGQAYGSAPPPGTGQPYGSLPPPAPPPQPPPAPPTRPDGFAPPS